MADKLYPDVGWSGGFYSWERNCAICLNLEPDGENGFSSCVGEARSFPFFRV